MNIETLLILSLSASALLFMPGCSKHAPEVSPETNIEDPAGPPHVVLETSRGAITLRLMPETAPKTVENFSGLVENGYYDGVIFHRVIKEFMIQGGDPDGTGMGGDSLWGGAFEDEFDRDVVFDRPGLLAMANSGPNTNRSQFFITTAETPWLNMRHTIFGEVVGGFDVLEAIENTPTGRGDRPNEDQTIIRAYLK